VNALGVCSSDQTRDVVVHAVVVVEETVPDPQNGSWRFSSNVRSLGFCLRQEMLNNKTRKTKEVSAPVLRVRNALDISLLLVLVWAADSYRFACSSQSRNQRLLWELARQTQIKGRNHFKRPPGPCSAIVRQLPVRPLAMRSMPACAHASSAAPPPLAPACPKYRWRRPT